MTARRRWVSAGVCAGIALVLVTARPAVPHAILASSDPADGARLTESPGRILLRFTEAPELSLSVVTLLDRSGAPVETTGLTVVPGQPTVLSSSVPDLETGVYTMTWRVVSKVDGHPSGGTLAFGVGVSPLEVPRIRAPEAETPEASPLEMAGRLVLFIGLGLLVGAVWIGALAFARTPPPVRRLAAWAWTGAAIGLAALALAQQRGAGVGFGEFLPTTPGRALLYRGGAIALAGTGLLAATAWPGSRRPALLGAGAAAAAAMLAHVTAGHAAARGDLAWAKVAAQWIHFVAAAVWLGGLAALLLGVRGKEDATKAGAVRRFSAVAGVALAAVAITGVVRSVNEVGSWGALISTGYGRLVLTKATLILGLAALGAVNRYRNVPQAASSLRRLRKVSRGELVLAVGAVGAAAALATLVPPAQVPAQARAPAAITAVGSDFATSVRARLEVDPGLPGPNRFVLRLMDYDSGEPVGAQRVSLGFSFVGGLEPAESTLELRPAGRGTYRGTGSNLSIGGTWEVDALVQRGADAVEVPLRVATLCEAAEIPGQGNQPPIHTVEVPEAGSVEGYLIPLGDGKTEVHFTFLDPEGRPVRVQGEPTMVASRPGEELQTLRPEFLAPGHYFAVAAFDPGEWRFDGIAAGEGSVLAGCFEEPVGG